MLILKYQLILNQLFTGKKHKIVFKSPADLQEFKSELLKIYSSKEINYITVQRG